MPRRPEIGNVQLYPNRPLTRRDRNGYVLKFYCPLRGQRIRRNCGTRDRREARRILRECRERLLNGKYAASDGAITEAHEVLQAPAVAEASTDSHGSLSWEDAASRYKQHKKSRVRKKSYSDLCSRLNVAERIFTGYCSDHGLPEGFSVTDVLTLPLLEYLQDRLLAGDECRYDTRSPNTVNSMMGAVMTFVRYCNRHGWIKSVPPVEKLPVDDVMKGRPVTTEEFERMLDVTPEVVGDLSAPSWQFALKVLWESGFRISDLMEFSWDDEHRIHPVWPKRKGVHPTIVIPPTQKNGRCQEIPMLPGLRELLEETPKRQRTGWIVTPLPVQYEIKATSDWFRPTDDDLRDFSQRFSNRSIATACGVSDTAVRKWLKAAGILRDSEFQRHTGMISRKEIEAVRKRATRHQSHAAQRQSDRLTVERVGRIVSLIGEAAAVVVQSPDKERGLRLKHATAHDLRRGCAARLIDAGVSAETLKIVMRHRDFATTEKHYGATRSAQSAAAELNEKSAAAQIPPFVGGLVGGHEKAPRFSPEELSKLKSLLNSL